MDHIITIATRQAPIDTLDPPTMGTLYRWECSCGQHGFSWRSMWISAWNSAGPHVLSRDPLYAEGK